MNHCSKPKAPNTAPFVLSKPSFTHSYSLFTFDQGSAFSWRSAVRGQKDDLFSERMGVHGFEVVALWGMQRGPEPSLFLARFRAVFNFRLLRRAALNQKTSHLILARSPLR